MASESHGAALLKNADSQALPQIPRVRKPRDEAPRFAILKTVTSSPGAASVHPTPGEC